MAIEKLSFSYKVCNGEKLLAFEVDWSQVGCVISFHSIDNCIYNPVVSINVGIEQIAILKNRLRSVQSNVVVDRFYLLKNLKSVQQYKEIIDWETVRQEFVSLRSSPITEIVHQFDKNGNRISSNTIPHPEWRLV